MRVIIPGGTGAVGQRLTRVLLNRGDQVAIVGRSLKKIKQVYSNRVKPILWNDLNADILASHDVLVQLSGKNIAEQRWSNAIKAEILSSRVDTSAQLADYCAELGPHAPRIFSASAVGIYGNSGDYADQPCPVDESWPIPTGQCTDFLTQVGQAWEAAWQPAIAANVPVTIMRFGVVLDPEHGMLKKILPAVKLGLAGKLGNGEQWLSYIAINDLINAILFMLDKNSYSHRGPEVVNMTSPNPIQQKDFIKALCRSYHRPCLVPMPGWLVKLLFGSMGHELLLNGQKVIPSYLIELGFSYDSETIMDTFRLEQ